MNHLYAPWRTSYVTEVSENKDNEKNTACLFCEHIKEEANDTTNFILARFSYTLVMLNLYPYNAGHLLVVPLTHCAQLNDLQAAARIELIEVCTKSTTILQEHLKAQGINIGVNIGKIAGASIPSHLHVHILPRWLGDTNFLPTLAHTKQISTDLITLYKILKPLFTTV